MENQTDAGAGGGMNEARQPHEAHNLEPTGSSPAPASTPSCGPYARAMRTNRGSCGGTTRLPPGTQYVSHEGMRARVRRHRQLWAQFEKLAASDSYAKVTRERLLDYVAEMKCQDEVRELIAMSIAMRARVHADEAKVSWTTAINQALNELEEAEDRRQRETIDPAKGVRADACA